MGSYINKKLRMEKLILLL